MDKNYCLSTALHWIPKMSSILSEIQQYLQYQAIQLITQRSFLFQQQKKAREYELLTYMLNSKFGQRKEHFFLFNGFGLKVPKTLSHFSISVSKSQIKTLK